MHKLKKPSLLDDDDDEDMSEFGRSSNRFLKTNRQELKQKDGFQVELENKIDQRNRSKSPYNDKNDELANTNRSSNRFMKRENENTKLVTPVRTPTPRSIATDIEADDDSGAESPFGGSKTVAMGNSGWVPGAMKSPRDAPVDGRKAGLGELGANSGRRSIFDKESDKDVRDSRRGDGSVEMSNGSKWNRPGEGSGNKTKNGIYNKEDEDLRFGKSISSKSSDDKNQIFGNDKSDSLRPKPRASKLKFDEEVKDDDSYRETSSSTRPFNNNDQYGIKRKDEKDSSRPKGATFSLDADEKEENSSRYLKNSKFLEQKDGKDTDYSLSTKSKNSKFSLDPYENEEDSLHEKTPSSRFLKNSMFPEQKDKKDADFSLSTKSKNSKFSLEPDENEKDSFHEKTPSSRFLKTDKDSDNKGKKDHDFSMELKSKKADEEERNRPLDKSRSSQSLNAKTPNSKEKEKQPISKNTTFSYDSDENEDSSIRDRSFSNQFAKTSKEPLHKERRDENVPIQPKPRQNKLNFNPYEDEEDLHQQHSKYKSVQANKPTLSDIREKYSDERDHVTKAPTKDSKPTSEHSNKDILGNHAKSDSKPQPRDSKDSFGVRRSIRFEDEEPTKSGHSSIENSPRKTKKVKPEDRQSRSPSPVTSVCEEFERDPVKQKLELMKQRRQERKRQEESANMNVEHRIAMEAIHAVGDHQGQPYIPPSTKKKVTVPPSKRYQNVQSKITTKPDLKSASMSNLNDILTKIEQPNTDRSFSASQAIREAAYLEWYKNKLREDKERKKDAPVEEKETNEKRNEDDIKKTYDTWLLKKKEYFAEMKKKKEAEQKKQAENKDSKDVKDNTFDIWKKMKDETKKQEAEKIKNESKKKEIKKNKECEEKKDELRKKKVEWEKRQVKDAKFKKERDEEIKHQEEEEKKKADDKQMMAEVSYRAWEDKMDEQKRLLDACSKKRESLVQNRRAWRPSSNTVSTGR